MPESQPNDELESSNYRPTCRKLRNNGARHWVAFHMAAKAYINRIATGVPRHDVHQAFIAFVESLLESDRSKLAVFRRMVERSAIDHRYSCLGLAPDWQTGPTLDGEGLYVRGEFANTAARMRVFEAHAPELAETVVNRLNIGAERSDITHLIVTSCTGFFAPGLDLEIMERCGLPNRTERNLLGFMGCSAGINALKLARHIVRSEPEARVLVLNLELCTLHLQETQNLAQLLCFLLFADGCAASLITSEPRGIALDSFHAVLIPDSRELMSWNIRDLGFDMVLSGNVPRAIMNALRVSSAEILGSIPKDEIDLWGIHPGGHSVLDAVERALQLPGDALVPSREVLRRFGNMSSATVMFVLERMMSDASSGARGCAMAFGPGLIAETMLFRMVGSPAKASLERTARDARVPA